MKKRWMLRQNTTNIKELSQREGISETLACILANREISTPEKVNKFLDCSLKDLNHGLSMKDMEKGTDLIIDGIKNNKKIVIYGDYDCDGVTSTTILYKALKKCNANVKYYIPDRENEGYGMCSDRVRLLREENVDIILTCDNGIAAIEQISLAKELGITVVVTDHHEVSFVTDENGTKVFKLPPADAVINPKQNDCTYPFKKLCGAGIAFKFAQILYEKMGINSEDTLELIEYAAIGTTCDVVDLIEENRIIVKNGLKMINTTNNLGLRALIKETGLEGKKISSYHIGYIIGPCINATGRLETAALSVELLLSDDEQRAESLAKKLKELNEQRQIMTMNCVEELTAIIENSNMKNDRVIVAYKPELHESIAGIVAGKIKEKFNVPTIVLCDGKEMPKGSARSIEEYNMFEELTRCKELIEQFGGHPMAAGLSLKEENIEALRYKLNENCKLTSDDIIPKIRIDKRINLKEVSIELVNELEKLEPFGRNNESPVLAEKDVLVNSISILGKDSNTLKLNCSIRGTIKNIDAIGFGKVNEFREMLVENYGDGAEYIIEKPKGLKLDMIFSPNINEFRGNINIQLRIIDFRLSENN